MSYGIRKFWYWTFTQHTSFYLTSYVSDMNYITHRRFFVHLYQLIHWYLPRILMFLSEQWAPCLHAELPTTCYNHSVLWSQHSNVQVSIFVTCLNFAGTGSRLYVALYVPTCIHLFPHARTNTIQVVEHEPNFSKFYPLTISFLVSQFCTLESSLCVSSSDYYLISPFGSSLIKVVLDPKIRTTECTHQTTSVHRINSWLITM